MKTYIASNYSMGRAVKTMRIQAWTYDDAARQAERFMSAANAGPATAGKSRGKTRVIGLKLA